MLSSFTRNIAFGRASTTSPSSSTFSSLGISNRFERTRVGVVQGAGVTVTAVAILRRLARSSRAASEPVRRPVADAHLSAEERVHQADPACHGNQARIAATAQDAALPDADPEGGWRTPRPGPLSRPRDPAVRVGGPDLHHL